MKKTINFALFLITLFLLSCSDSSRWDLIEEQHEEFIEDILIAQSTPAPSASPAPSVTPTPPFTGDLYEAEAPANQLNGSATPAPSANYSGGFKVTGIGDNADNYIQFNNINAVQTGNYTMTIYYCSAAPKDIYYSIDGAAAQQLTCPATGGDDIVGSEQVTIPLNMGTRNIKFTNDSDPAPDLDKITIEAQ